MCSEFTIKTTPEQLAESLDREIINSSSVNGWDRHIRLTNKAPILYLEKDQVSLAEGIFPQAPFPNSRLSGLEVEEGSRDDNQVKRIYERPTWKKGFEQNPCLIPMTSFLEPVYWGDKIGSVVEFTPSEDELLFTAGIRIKPRVPKTETLNGFSLLTHTPTPQMLKYHHRLLVFLKPADAMEWIEDLDSTAQEKFNFLLNKRYLPKLEVNVQRKMASGWKARADKHVRSLEQEKQYIQTLRNEQVAG